MHKNSRGFVLIIPLILVLTLVGIAGYLAYQSGLINTPFNVTKTEPQPKPTTDPTTDWKTYRSEGYGLEFKYPESWEVSESPLEIGIFEPNQLLGFIVTTTQSDTSRENLISNLTETVDQFPSQTLYLQPDIQFGNHQTIEVRDQQKSHTQSDIYVVLENKQIIIHSTFLYSDSVRRDTINQILSTFEFIK